MGANKKRKGGHHNNVTVLATGIQKRVVEGRTSSSGVEVWRRMDGVSKEWQGGLRTGDGTDGHAGDLMTSCGK